MCCIDAEDLQMQTWNKRRREEKREEAEKSLRFGVSCCVCYTNIQFLFVYIMEKDQ